MKAGITFCGFYESAHDADLDAAAGQMASSIENTEWAKVYQQYAEDYAQRFLDAVEVPGTFAGLYSPREYNFTTDTIEVEVEPADMRKAFARAIDLGLIELVRKELEPRSGFAPFFSNDVTRWGPVDKWNTAQTELIFRLLAADTTLHGEWDQQAEIDLMEPARSNGMLEAWIGGNSSTRSTTVELKIRLTYEGEITKEQAGGLLLNALEHCRQESMLSDPQQLDLSCAYVELISTPEDS